MTHQFVRINVTIPESEHGGMTISTYDVEAAKYLFRALDEYAVQTGKPRPVALTTQDVPWVP